MDKIMVIDFEDSFVYNIIEFLRKEKVDFFVINASKVSTSVDYDFTSVILSPGGAIPSEYPNIMKFIDLYHTNRPMLGICLGFQAICSYFGAELYKIERPLHGHSGTLSFTTTKERLFKGVENGCHVGLYHSWAIRATQESPIEVLAVDERGVVMAIKHSSLPLYGMQFHPESIISGQAGSQMLRNWIEISSQI